LVVDTVMSPLGMTATLPMDGSFVAEKAVGFDTMGREQKTELNWGAYGPAGAFRSNMEDMLRYAAAHARAASSPVEPLVAFAQRAYGDGPKAGGEFWIPDTGVTFGLLFARRGGNEVPDTGFHLGLTPSFMSELQVVPQEKIATVVLMNRALFDNTKSPA